MEEKQKDFEKKVEQAREEYLTDEEEKVDGNFVPSDEDIEFSEDSEEETKTGGGLFSGFISKMKNFTGNKEMTREELEPIMKQFSDGLTEKNVAAEIANKLCDSVVQSLLK